jgi:hypothetical protein
MSGEFTPPYRKPSLAPKDCCHSGAYTCQIIMPINGRVCGIDICISDVVAALNASGLITEASCCGHGENRGRITLADGRELFIQYPDAKLLEQKP